MSEWEIKFLGWMKKGVLNCRDLEIAQEGMQLLMEYAAEMGPTSTTLSGFVVEMETYTELVNLLKEEKKIKAIKRFKDVTGAGLKESKYAIDDLEKELRIEGVLPTS